MIRLHQADMDQCSPCLSRAQEMAQAISRVLAPRNEFMGCPVGAGVPPALLWQCWWGCGQGVTDE